MKEGKATCLILEPEASENVGRDEQERLAV